MSSLTLIQIYNELLAGKKMQMEFAGPIELSQFKQALYQCKRRQEAPAVAIGAMTEEDKQAITFVRLPDLTNNAYEFYMKDRTPRKTYNVVIVDEQATAEGSIGEVSDYKTSSGS